MSEQEFEVLPAVPNDEGAELEGQTAPPEVVPGEFVDDLGVFAQ